MFNQNRIYNNYNQQNMEHEGKEILKWIVDNGNRKLTKEEKEVIKTAIDQVNNINDLGQIAVSSAFIDLNR